MYTRWSLLYYVFDTELVTMFSSLILRNLVRPAGFKTGVYIRNDM